MMNLMSPPSELSLGSGTQVPAAREWELAERLQELTDCLRILFADRGGPAPAALRPAGHPWSAPRGPRLTALTAREVQVLEMISRGASNKRIAIDLDLSVHTVKRHVANILDKLAVPSRGQAAALYLRASTKTGL